MARADPGRMVVRHLLEHRVRVQRHDRQGVAQVVVQRPGDPGAVLLLDALRAGERRLRGHALRLLPAGLQGTAGADDLRQRDGQSDEHDVAQQLVAQHGRGGFAAPDPEERGDDEEQTDGHERERAVTGQCDGGEDDEQGQDDADAGQAHRVVRADGERCEHQSGPRDAVAHQGEDAEGHGEGHRDNQVGAAAVPRPARGLTPQGQEQDGVRDRDREQDAQRSRPGSGLRRVHATIVGTGAKTGHRFRAYTTVACGGTRRRRRSP